MKFQLQYKNNSKTHTTNIETVNYQTARNFFDDMFDGELFEIREYQHEDDTEKKDDGDYVKYKSIFLRGQGDSFCSFKIPKVKKNIDDDYILKSIPKMFKVNGKKPLSAKITTKN